MKVVTMRGKNLDMAALIAKNPHAVAVGNAQMNARGDIITARGKVVKAREQIAMDYHASNPRSVRTVGIRALTSEMLQTPAAAIAAAQAALKQGAPGPAIAGAATAGGATAGTTPEMPPAEPWTGHNSPSLSPAAMGHAQAGPRKRKLVDPDEPLDGGV